LPAPKFRWVVASICAATALPSGTSVLGSRVEGGGGSILFTATQSDVPVDGHFKLFSADVEFDPEKPNAGRVALVIDVGSVTTGSAEADSLLKEHDFFDVKSFPQATFTAKAVRAVGSGQFQATGDFSLKGHTMEVVIPFTAKPDPGGLLIEGRFPISRRAYDVGEGQWADTGTIAEQVQIRFSLQVQR
jgi:polyisoprenoid-binding protein YceI